MQNPDTIAAIATPLGSAGVGVIRVSGPLSPEAGRALFRPAHGECAWQSHHVYHGDLVSADGSRLLDEVLVTLMRKPRSFTGEDVLEIACHSNPLILKEILEQLVRRGCRLARPGEFSQRAFLNGRMDLSQAEALAAMISARSEKAFQIGLAQLKGVLGNQIGNLRKLLIDALAQLETTIDFTDDVAQDEFPLIPPQMEEALIGLDLLLSTYPSGRLLNEGISVVITGKPNVGKSSLLNQLAGRKKAIVTDIPGTTRDAITETLNINGLCLHLTDTAGIRKPLDDIEKEGMELAEEYLQNSDIIILILDGSQPLTPDDHLLLEQNADRKQRLLIAVNKSDLPAAWSRNQISDAGLSDTRIFQISAKYGHGLDLLRQAVLDFSIGNPLTHDDHMIIHLRHKLALEKAQTCLVRAKEGLFTGQSPEFIAFEVREAINFLDEITGKRISDDVLEKIFSSFCIGK